MIGVETYIVDQSELVPLAQDIQHPARKVDRHPRKPESNDDCLRVHLADRLRRADQQFGIGRRLVRPPQVGFVPDLPLVHSILVTRHNRRHVALPGLQRRLISENPRSQALLRPVNRIPVGQAHPRANPLFAKAVDRFVEPSEIVAALLLLATSPAALDTRSSNPQLSHIGLVGRKIGILTVETFAPDRPARIRKFPRRPRLDTADKLQPRRNRLHLLPCQRPMLRQNGRRKTCSQKNGKESFFHFQSRLTVFFISL